MKPCDCGNELLTCCEQRNGSCVTCYAYAPGACECPRFKAKLLVTYSLPQTVEMILPITGQEHIKEAEIIRELRRMLDLDHDDRACAKPKIEGINFLGRILSTNERFVPLIGRKFHKILAASEGSNAGEYTLEILPPRTKDVPFSLRITHGEKEALYPTVDVSTPKPNEHGSMARMMSTFGLRMTPAVFFGIGGDTNAD